MISNANPNDKIIVLKIEGVLELGKTSDIDFYNLQKKLTELGAKEVLINSNRLTTKEYQEVKIDQNVKDVEYRVFKEKINSIKTTYPKLQGDDAISLSIQLLDVYKIREKIERKKQ